MKAEGRHRLYCRLAVHRFSPETEYLTRKPWGPYQARKQTGNGMQSLNACKARMPPPDIPCWHRTLAIQKPPQFMAKEDNTFSLWSNDEYVSPSREWRITNISPNDPQKKEHNQSKVSVHQSLLVTEAGLSKSLHRVTDSGDEFAPLSLMVSPMTGSLALGASCLASSYE